MVRYLIPVSLLLNIVFAGLILTGKQPPVLSPSISSATVTATNDSNRESSASIIEVQKTHLPQPDSGLSWDKLKSSDLRQFVANLRKAGAPEQVVEYLALAAWEDRFNDERDKKLEFWMAGASLWQAVENRDNSRKRMELEGRSLFKELFGYVPDRNFKKNMAKHGEILFVMGFIPDPKFERFINELSYIEKSDQNISVMYKRAMEMANAQLAPSEVEEARLRLLIFAASKMSKEFSTIGLSGYQSREVLRALFQTGKDPIEKLLNYDGSGGPMVDLDPAVVGSIINPTQLAKLQRLADPLLDQAYVFAEGQGLPAETAVQLNQITLAAKQEMESIKDKYLLAENRKKAQADVQHITMETFRKIIPPDKMSAFQQQYGQMLRGMVR